MVPIGLWTVAVLLLLAVGTFSSPSLALAAGPPVIGDVGTWKQVSVDHMTVMLHSERPFFIWWSSDAPSVVYYLRFNSIFEHLGDFVIVEKEMALPPGSSLQSLAEDLWRQMRRNLTESEPSRDMPEPKWILLPFPRVVLKGFPFALARWSLSISTLADSVGKVTGVTFEYALVAVPTSLSSFSHLVGNLVLKGRIYTADVRESFAGLTYDLAPGEVKVDVVVKKWVWQLGGITRLMRSVAPPGVNFTFPTDRLGLALRFGTVSIGQMGIPSITAPEADRIEEQASGDGPVLPYAYQTLAVLVSHAKFFRELVNQAFAPGSERPAGNAFVFASDQAPLDLLTISPRPRFQVPLNDSLGYFRFVDKAVTLSPGGVTQLVDVRASYRPLVGAAWIYLSYPYFGDKTLVHDPIMGTISPTGAGVSPAGQEPPVQVELRPDPQNLGDYSYTFVYAPGFNTVLAGALAGTVVIALVFFASRRKRLDVLDR